MECLRAFLKENGFRIGSGIVTTVKTLSGSDASDDGVANYINAFRDAVYPSPISYTLVPDGASVRVATDCSIGAILDDITKYASILIRDDTVRRFYVGGTWRISTAELTTVSVSGTLCYRYETPGSAMPFQTTQQEIALPELSLSILEYARKVLPRCFLPLEGK